MERVALGGSFKKLFFPSLHIGTKSFVGMCPARRSGRSEKQTVKCSTLRNVSFPSAKLSPAAFWTKSTWTALTGLLSADEPIFMMARVIIKMPPHMATKRWIFTVVLRLYVPYFVNSHSPLSENDAESQVRRGARRNR